MRLYKWLFFLVSILFLVIWSRYDLSPYLSDFVDGFLGGLLIAGVLGVAMVEIGRYWTARREPDMAIPAGEHLLKKDVASWARGMEVVRGKLFLTNRALYFRSHSLSRNPIAFDVPLDSIQAVINFNHRRIFPFGVQIRTSSEVIYAMLLEDRAAWREALVAQLSKGKTKGNRLDLSAEGTRQNGRPSL